ncbi:hypothetical protein [Microcoleus sp. CAWBG58]|uniref:hypothetical protein n=1 Tax=Microcoleus sp. CAWBG58 TaxID=2841651 RepID=UPI0025FAAADF|nr:hypothetical protein [Microcoleus sp. CAWBG58]
MQFYNFYEQASCLFHKEWIFLWAVAPSPIANSLSTYEDRSHLILSKSAIARLVRSEDFSPY